MAKPGNVIGRKMALAGVIILAALLASSVFFLSDDGTDAKTVASGMIGDTSEWTLDDTGLLTISGTGEVPDWGVNESPWHSYATGTYSIKSVSIENGITNLGSNAFYSCTNITTVTLSNSVVSLGESCFNTCSALTTVTLPSSLNTIGNSAFYKCSALTKIVIPNSVQTIGNNAFYQCSKITSMTLGSGIVSIGEGAFSGLTSLAKFVGTYSGIVNGTLVICNNTLIASAPKSTTTAITIPSKVTIIGAYAFEGSSLVSVTIPDSVTTIKDYAFQNCYSLKSVVIPDSVTSVGSYTFYGDSSLASVTLSSKIVTVAPHMFHSCRALTSITIPSGITTIGNNAFYQCSNLKSISLSNTLTAIGGYAFSGCSSLTKIYIPHTVTQIASNAFNGFKFFASDGKTQIASTAQNLAGFTFEGTTIAQMIKQATLSHLTYYVDGAIYTTQTVEEGSLIVLPADPVVPVPEGYSTYTFSKWAEYTEGMKAYGDMDFHAVFTSVPKTYSVTYDIEGMKYTFSASYGDIIVEPPFTPTKASSEGVEYVFDGWYCETPSTTVIGDMVFTAVFKSVKTCTVTIYYYSVDVVNGNSIYSCIDSTNVLVEKGSTLTGPREVFAYYTSENFTTKWSTKRTISTDMSLYAVVSAAGEAGADIFWEIDFTNGSMSLLGSGSMYSWSTVSAVPWYAYMSAIETITISNGITTIGQNAFKGCSALYSVSFPDSVKTIGKQAFYHDYCLERIEVGSGLKKVESGAFSGIKLLYTNGAKATITANTLFTGKEGTLYCNEVSGTISTSVEWVLTFDTETLVFFGEGEIPDYDTATSMPWYPYRASINSIIIDDGITKVGVNAFYSFDRLTKVEIGNDVLTLGYHSFAGCPNISYMYVGSSIEDVDGTAFNCTFTDTKGNNFVPYAKNLANRTFISGGYNTLVFASTWGTTGDVTWKVDCIEKTLTFDGDGAMENYGSVTKTPWYPLRAYFDTAIIGNGVTNLTDYAFYGNNNVKTVIIGDNVEVLGTNSLRNMNSIEKISFGESLTTIKSNALTGITFLDANGNTMKATADKLVEHTFVGSDKVLKMVS